ncbi:hypothetical protein ACIQM3_33835 [Streptomyces sp. NPDC091271]|uniref:hypothetical protein n=1 Tax=Streptomyces sp. NPDC091271 TaxID=3365980 RepID=UPI00382BA522
MQQFPASLFSDGPVPKLLDIAIAVQESDGKLSLDEEIQRYIRLIHRDGVADWNCSVYASSGVLDVAADIVARSGNLEAFPSEFRKKSTRAAGDVDLAEYLRTLAELVRILDRQGVVEYSELSMGAGEFLQTFPHLFGFEIILVDEADHPFADIVRSFLTSEHPYCHERAAAYSTEAQRALVLFPGADGLKEHISWATRDRLHEIVDTINDHMQREHS